MASQKKKKREKERGASHEEQTHQAKGSPTGAATKGCPPKSHQKESPNRHPIQKNIWTSSNGRTTEDQRQDKTRLSIPRYELVIPKLLGLFQTIKVDELVYCEHVSISYGRSDYHTAYENSPQIRHKLPWCKV